MPRAPSYTCCARVSPANFVEEVGLMHKSNYNMDTFVAPASCFLQRSGLYFKANHRCNEHPVIHGLESVSC